VANRYDDAIKALCAVDLTGLCRWLGVPVAGGRAEPIRLSESVPVASTRAVDLLLAAGPGVVVHVEFQTKADPGFALRMLDYWIRLRALPELEGRTIHQHVVFLGRGRLPAGLVAPGLDFRYPVHRVIDEDPALFLVDPSMAPFAALARMPEAARPAVLARALRLADSVSDGRLRDVLLRVTVDLAFSRIDPAIIRTTEEEAAMPYPTRLHELFEPEIREGEARGLEQGALSLLRIRFGDDPRIEGLAHELAALGAPECMARIEKAHSLDELV
jgi:hypothetical protein